MHHFLDKIRIAPCTNGLLVTNTRIVEEAVHEADDVIAEFEQTVQWGFCRRHWMLNQQHKDAAQSGTTSYDDDEQI